MSEELLNPLAQIPKLRVIACTPVGLVQRQVGRRRDDCQDAGCGERACGQRAQVWQHPAHHRAADSRLRKLASMVGHLRPEGRQCLRRAGRDRQCRGRGTQGPPVVGGPSSRFAHQRPTLDPITSSCSARRCCALQIAKATSGRWRRFGTPLHSTRSARQRTRSWRLQKCCFPIWRRPSLRSEAVREYEVAEP